MRKVLSLIVATFLVFVQFVPLQAQENLVTQELYSPITGTIIKSEDGILEVKAQEKTYNVKYSEKTYIVDAVNGNKITLENLKSDTVSISFDTTKVQNNDISAIAIFANIPADYMPPKYSKVEEIESVDNGIKLLVDNSSLYVTIPTDLKITDFNTDKSISASEIKVGSELVLWYTKVALSYPGQTTAEKVVLLNVVQDTSNKLITINNNTVKDNSPIVKGNLPSFTSQNNKDIAVKLNELVDNFQKKSIEKIDKDVKEFLFSYEVKESLNYTSVILNTSISNGNDFAEFVSTIVFDNKTAKVYTLKNILGENAFQIAEKVINDEIAKNPDNYLQDIPAVKVNDDSSFYVEGNIVKIIFDKYSIAIGAMGTPTFDIDSNNIKNFNLNETSSESFKNDNGIVMVPLREISNSLGYSIEWNPTNKSIILNDNNNKYEITIGSVKFNKTALEAAPVIKNDTTFVPLSLFKEIEVIYSIHGNSILFSKLIQ